DPVAVDEARERRFGDRIEYAANNYDALEGADALVIHTEWHPYRRPDFQRMRAAMSTPIVFDGRNLYDPGVMSEQGFEYHSIGRPPVVPGGASPRHRMAAAGSGAADGDARSSNGLGRRTGAGAGSNPGPREAED